MKEITITSKKYGNQIALVDDEDFEFLNQWKWFLKPGSNTFYANRRHRISNGKYKHVKMHRLIMKVVDDPNILIDHLDRNGLNNQKGNIRVATFSQNSQNQTLRKNKTSKYLGVSWSTHKRKWVAHIAKDKKIFHIGRYFTENEAAIAYNNMAIKLYGEFARKNEVV